MLLEKILEFIAENIDAIKFVAGALGTVTTGVATYFVTTRRANKKIEAEIEASKLANEKAEIENAFAYRVSEAEAEIKEAEAAIAKANARKAIAEAEALEAEAAMKKVDAQVYEKYAEKKMKADIRNTNATARKTEAEAKEIINEIG